jgi:hypothetical protein
MRLARDTTAESRPPDPTLRDRGGGATERSEISHDLESVGARVDALWATALIRKDFREVDRLVEVSHAVHRALIALQPDSVIPRRRFGDRPGDSTGR